MLLKLYIELGVVLGLGFRFAFFIFVGVRVEEGGGLFVNIGLDLLLGVVGIFVLGFFVY